MRAVLDPFDAIVAPLVGDEATSFVESMDGLQECRVISERRHWAVEALMPEGIDASRVHGFASEASAEVWARAHAEAAWLASFPHLRRHWALHRWRERRVLTFDDAEFRRVERSLSAND